MRHYFQPSEADTFARLNLLPKLSQLSSDERASFDALVVERYEPQIHKMKPWTVHEILRRLDLDQLTSLSDELTN